MSTARATATGANLERRAIALRVPTSGRSEVKLLGELGDWSNAQPVHGDEVRLEVPVGVYAYKFRVGGEWAMDPANPRTRSAGGLRNNVVSVGGAQEPILFAPAAPFVVEHEPFHDVFTQPLRGPDTELGGDARLHPIADGDDGVEVIVFQAPADLPGTLLANR